jgi:hypothetical protein
MKATYAAARPVKNAAPPSALYLMRLNPLSVTALAAANYNAFQIQEE